MEAQNECREDRVVFKKGGKLSKNKKGSLETEGIEVTNNIKI
jgi:hypothetical protein